MTAEDQKKLAEWNGKRDGLRREISEDLLRHYERVMKFRRTGLAEVLAQKCTGCQVMLRPQMYNEVRIGDKVVFCDSCQRIFYYNPDNDVVAEEVAGQAKKRPRPKSDAPQAWFYRPDYGEDGEVFLVFTNKDGNSTRRTYEMHTGRQIGGVLQREGSYRQAFPEDLTDSALRLNGHWDETEIDEEWGTEIPSNALDALLKDLLAVQRENRSTHKSHASTSPEHTAAH